MIKNSVNYLYAGLEGCAQKIGAYPNGEALRAKLDWVWRNVSGAVKGYPSIISGWSIWTAQGSPNQKSLPAKLSELPTLLVDYDLILDVLEGASYNTAFDLWVTDRLNGTTENITYEVMVFINRSNYPLSAGSVLLAHVVIDGVDYDLYTHPTSPGGFYSFIAANNSYHGNVSIKSFMDYLTFHGYIPSDHVLMDINFGNEVVSGVGTMTVANYRVTN